MANPQKENGYTAISNEIMTALAKIRINGEARQVLDFIFLKTYGWNKKDDCISLSQFYYGTGLKRPTICKALNKLKSMNIITQKDNDIANKYSIVKNYELWKPLPKKITLPKKVIGITQKGNESLPKKPHTITTNTKATITKAISEPSSQNIEKVFETFYLNGNKGINFGNKTERSAAEWLVKEYGLEKTINTIKYALSLIDKQYAPVITTPYQLKTNMVKLMAYYQREKNNNLITNIKL